MVVWKKIQYDKKHNITKEQNSTLFACIKNIYIKKQQNNKRQHKDNKKRQNSI